MHLALDEPGYDLRLPDRQLEPFAAHLLDEHLELELAAALDFPPVGPLGGKDAKGNVADELAAQARLDVGRGHLVALATGERGCVGSERHRERGLVDRDHGQRPRVVRVGQRFADRHLRDAGNGDDLARSGLLGLDPLERVRHVELGHLRALDRPVGAAPRDLLRTPDRALDHPAEREAADVRRGIEVRDQRLKRMALFVCGRRNMLDDQVEQRLEVVCQRVRLQPGQAGAGIAVDDRELDLALVGVEVEEELVHLVHDLDDPRVGAVDLVHHEDHRQLRLERLAQHEPGLGEGALTRVDEQENPVDHRQPALDLAAEVGMARRVDDVDLRLAVADSRVLGQDRDSLLALQVARVHDPFGHVLVRTERSRLPEHRVHERGLAVVDMRDDRNVADVGPLGHRARVAAIRCPSGPPGESTLAQAAFLHRGADVETHAGARPGIDAGRAFSFADGAETWRLRPCPRDRLLDEPTTDPASSVVGMHADLLDVGRRVDDIQQKVANRSLLGVDRHKSAAALGIARQLLD